MGFTFNGKTSQSMGITARVAIWQAAPKLRNYFVTVPGADGVADMGANLTEREISISCSIMPRFSLGGLMAVIDGLTGWLNPLAGTQALVIDGMEDRYFNARLSDSIDFSRLPFSSGNFDLKFVCPDPYAYAATDELFAISTVGNSNISRVKGNACSYPVYSLKAAVPTGQGNVTIATNGAALTIIGSLSPGETLKIDSGTLTAHVADSTGAVLRNGLPLLQSLNFPVLHTGNNAINVAASGATFTQLQVEARSRWL